MPKSFLVFPVLEVDMELPDWFTEGEPELDVGLLPSFSADGLIQRANGNIETRRHNGQEQYQYGAQSNPVNNPPIHPQMSYQEQFGAQQKKDEKKSTNQ